MLLISCLIIILIYFVNYFFLCHTPERIRKELEGLEHLKQSIIDILTTPIGSRVMRREYGSRLFELVDKPVNRDFTLEIYAATAGALEKWEKRFKLEKVKITEVKEGKVTISLDGIYLPSGKNIHFEGIIV